MSQECELYSQKSGVTKSVWTQKETLAGNSSGRFDLPMTTHAVTRCSQRGIKKQVVDFVLANFDRDYDAGDGAAAISISRDRLAELEEEGVPKPLIGQARRTVLVIGPDGAIITTINRPNWYARFHNGADRLGHRQRRRHRASSPASRFDLSENKLRRMH